MSGSSPPSTYRPPGRPRVAADAAIFAAADELFRAGVWPSADALLARLGGGSKGTIHRVQRQWRDALPQRFTAKGSAALERLPENIAHIAEAFWIQAQEEARRSARQEAQGARDTLDRDQQTLALQRHVLTLREQEMQRQLQERERAGQVLEDQLREQTLLLRKMAASRDADARHIRELQAKLDALTRRPRPPSRPKRPNRKPQPSKSKARRAKPAGRPRRRKRGR